MLQQRDVHRPVRPGLGELPGAVQRVDDPQPAGRWRRPTGPPPPTAPGRPAAAAPAPGRSRPGPPGHRPRPARPGQQPGRLQCGEQAAGRTGQPGRELMVIHCRLLRSSRAGRRAAAAARFAGHVALLLPGPDRRQTVDPATTSRQLCALRLTIRVVQLCEATGGFHRAPAHVRPPRFHRPTITSSTTVRQRRAIDSRRACQPANHDRQTSPGGPSGLRVRVPDTIRHPARCRPRRSYSVDDQHRPRTDRGPRPSARRPSCESEPAPDLLAIDGGTPVRVAPVADL